MQKQNMYKLTHDIIPEVFPKILLKHNSTRIGNRICFEEDVTMIYINFELVFNDHSVLFKSTFSYTSDENNHKVFFTRMSDFLNNSNININDKLFFNLTKRFEDHQYDRSDRYIEYKNGKYKTCGITLSKTHESIIIEMMNIVKEILSNRRKDSVTTDKQKQHIKIVA